MSVPSNDINNIMDYLMKKDDSMNQNINVKMEGMDVGYGMGVSDSFLTDEWPTSSEDLLDNIFSMDGGLLELGGGAGGWGAGAAGGAAGSDSGLSMDHADLDLIDQQLSPLLMHNHPDDDVLNSSFHLVSPLDSSASQSPQSASSPSHSTSSPSHSASSPSHSSSGPSSDAGSPVNCYEDLLAAPVPSPEPQPPVRAFQNASNLKRKSAASPTAVVLPKIQKHYISKRDIIHGKAVSAHRPDGTKQRILLSNYGGPNASLASNIQIVNNQSVTVQSGDISSTQRKIIRVAPVAGNPRSILLPVTIKDMKDLRSIKIINATDLKNPANIKIAAANFLQKSKQVLDSKKNNILFATSAFDSEDHHYVMEDSTSDRGSGRSDDDDDDDGPDDEIPVRRGSGQFPRLELTGEERRLLAKEGISLPASYPLTRLEERELKRIRRKIRNKISAQDSRRRKKEYVDGLEDRVKQCTEENQTLMKRIKALQSQNHSLATQLRKLQSMVSKSGYKSAQPATCLMVLLLSVALVVAPSLRAGPPSASAPPPPPGLLSSIRRALLSAPLVPPQQPFTGAIMAEESAEEDFNMEELVSFTRLPSDHDYPLVVPRGKFSSYMDIPLDEDRPPAPPEYAHSCPVKLEMLEYDTDYDGSHLYLSHQEEVEDTEPDVKDFKDETIRLYDAAMEKLEILSTSEGVARVTGKMGEILEMAPSIIRMGNNAEVQRKKNITETRTIVVNGSAMELQ